MGNLIKSNETKNETKNETPEERYNQVDRELQELTDNDDSNDKVEIIKKDLDDAFRKFLLNDPDKLGELIQKANELEQIGNNSGGKGFRILLNFLKKLKAKQDNLETKESNSETGLDSDEYKENVNEVQENIINECYNILRTGYTLKKSEDGTLQLKDRNSSSQDWIDIDADGVMKKFGDEFKANISNQNNLTIDEVNKMWDSWLSNENDESDGNTFKDNIYDELLSNALDENDIEIVEGLIAKYKFKKSEDGTLQFKDRNNPSQQWISIDVDGIKSVEGIGDHNKDKIYQELLDSALDENDD